MDDEVVVVASERPVIQTVFNVPFETVHELDPGHAIITKKSGSTKIKRIITALERKPALLNAFIFREEVMPKFIRNAKNLARLLMPKVLEAINDDTENTVFSFIPNTAETSFFGMIDTVEEHLNEKKTKAILDGNGNLSAERLSQIFFLNDHE